MEYYSLNDYLKNTFGCKVYKIAIDAGFTCTVRDGTLDKRGCIFCSGRGSGDFAGRPGLSVSEQIDMGKDLLKDKIKDGKYIAYFQAFTNTYAPTDVLREKYTEAVQREDICCISIATRPDCLPDDVLDLLSEINEIKPVWVELGLQTIHERTAEYIRRHYPLHVYDKAVNALRDRNIEVITHVILGLPGETEKDMLETVSYVGRSGANGIKLQLLHILKGTDLEKEYNKGNIKVLELEEYVSLIKKCLQVLPKDMVIHRLTGDGSKKDLIAPLWSADKKRVLNTLKRELQNG